MPRLLRHAPPVANQMALAPALGPIGGIRTGLVPAVHRTDGTTVHDCPRPINLVGASEPVQERKVDQIPHARLLPVAHAPPARHSRFTPEFLREHLPGDAAAKDKENAGQTRASETRGRPPFGRRCVTGKNGSTISHNGSGSSAAAIPIHVTSPMWIRFPRFCYTLLG